MDQGPDKEKSGKAAKYIIKLCISMLLPALIFIFQPLGMSMQQSAVLAVLMLVIIWWSTGWVDKTLASCILILFFLLFSGAPAKTVLTFPLSPTFLLIALTYLFSRGIKNSQVAEKYIEPMLLKFGNTPLKTLLFGTFMLIVTMYIIPQPLARLIIVTDTLRAYLDKTDADSDIKSTLLFGMYFMYLFVNMLTMNADIILNTTSAAVAGLKMRDLDWIKYMAVPSLIYGAAAFAAFCLLFRKKLKMQTKFAYNSAESKSGAEQSRKNNYAMEILVVVTMLLWLTEPLHNIPSWLVTMVSIVIMYIMGDLKVKDLSAIDVKMLIFLTAAMSIGGVMSANGTANRIFSILRNMISGDSIASIMLPIMLITICMHMILGSNTTTVSVVIPGVIFMCSDILPSEIVMFTVYITTVAQWLFPFHSVPLMMGVSQDYFSSKHVLKMGIALTAMVFIAIFALYIPWWKLIGVISN